MTTTTSTTFPALSVEVEKQMPLVEERNINSLWLDAQARNFGDRYPGYVLPIPDDGDDWMPTPHGYVFTDALFDHPELFKGRDVVELGCGLGTQTIPIMAGKPSSLTVTEITEARLHPTRVTLEANKFDISNVKFIVADWMRWTFKTDVLVTCPPFAWAGMPYRRHFIDTLIHLARDALTDKGTLIFTQSSMADVEQSIDLLKKYHFSVRIVRAGDYFWREYYLRHDRFLKDAEEVQARTGGKAFIPVKSEDGASVQHRIERLYCIVATKEAFDLNDLKH